MRVHRVVREAARWLVNDLKGCGIYLFQPDFFDAVRLTPRTALRDEYEITHAIQISIDLGHRVFVAPVVEWDLNITFSAGDILVGNRYWRERLGLANVVAPEAEVHPEARLSGAMVGARAKIRHPIALDNVVVFADADVGVREAPRRLSRVPRSDRALRADIGVKDVSAHRGERAPIRPARAGRVGSSRRRS